MKEENATVALNHSSRWGENLTREFGIDSSNSRYTQDELQEIDNLTKAIEESRREIE